MIKKRRFCISMPESVIEQIDNVRGDVKRSHILTKLVQSGLSSCTEENKD
jgi:metal-responsive CopG/Arc/MetJ family transcriptional regulator